MGSMMWEVGSLMCEPPIELAQRLCLHCADLRTCMALFGVNRWWAVHRALPNSNPCAPRARPASLSLCRPDTLRAPSAALLPNMVPSRPNMATSPLKWYSPALIWHPPALICHPPP
eukprot:4615480-Prymnesium_polylepis.1